MYLGIYFIMFLSSQALYLIKIHLRKVTSFVFLSQMPFQSILTFDKGSRGLDSPSLIPDFSIYQGLCCCLEVSSSIIERRTIKSECLYGFMGRKGWTLKAPYQYPSSLPHSNPQIIHTTSVGSKTSKRIVVEYANTRILYV